MARKLTAIENIFPIIPSAPPRLRVSLCIAFASACAFCQTGVADWPKLWPSSSRIKESKYPPPARMAILWGPAMLNEAGKTPVRGFGGRIYFYDSKNKPIPVEGQLVVYGYDNNKPGGESKVPDRKYCFTPEQFTNHFAPTEMGASYSIWLPWDAVGQPQADISLVPIFTSSGGALVMGQASRAMLPGPNTPPTTSSIVDGTLPAIEMRPSLITGDPTHRDSAVQQAAFQQEAAKAAAIGRGNEPTTMATVPGGEPQTATNGRGFVGQPEVSQQGGVSTLSMTLPGTLSDRLAQAPPQVSLLQQMAALRQEAMAKQAGYSAPTLLGGAGVSPALSDVAGQRPAPQALPRASSAALPLPANKGVSSATAIPAGPPVTLDPAGQRPLPQTTAWSSPAKATSPSWSPGPTPQPARFSPPSQPALGGRSLPQVAGPPPTQPGPVEQPSYLPGSPQLSPVSSVQAP